MNGLGIDIGGTFIKYAIINNKNVIVKKWKKETKKNNHKDAFYDYVCEGIPKTITFDYIGVSAPGVIDAQSKVMTEASRKVRIMYQTVINEEIVKRLKKPTYSLNDAKAAGYCEWKIGNAKGTVSSAYYIIGTGIGGCFCDAKGSINGIDNIAGELSCLPFSIEKGKIISAAHYASMTALISLYNQRVAVEKQVDNGKAICDLYIAGDVIAKEVVEQWCLYIVFALITIVICHNPEVLCIGGGISEEDWFIEKIQELYQCHFPKRFSKLVSTNITRCLYNNDANLLGAVVFANEQFSI